MSRRVAQSFAVLLALLALTILAGRWRASQGDGAPALPNAPESITSGPATQTSPREAPIVEQIADPAFLRSFNAANSDIVSDLRLVSGLLETFRTNFPREGNPVGDNAEITAALTGRNPLHLAFLPRNHSAIDAQGALCDRWGTPFFFHQISGVDMEIRSAGADRQLWTADDVVLTP